MPVEDVRSIRKCVVLDVCVECVFAQLLYGHYLRAVSWMGKACKVKMKCSLKSEGKVCSHVALSLGYRG